MLFTEVFMHIRYIVMKVAPALSMGNLPRGKQSMHLINNSVVTRVTKLKSQCVI